MKELMQPRIYTHIDEEVFKNEGISLEWKTRDFVQDLEDFFEDNGYKYAIVAGLRSTGKTVGILQFLKGKKALYISANELGKNDPNITKRVREFIIKKCSKYDYIVIDEFTWFKDYRKLLNDLIKELAKQGKKIIISGIETLNLYKERYANGEQRVRFFDTTFRSYSEYLRMEELSHTPTSYSRFVDTDSFINRATTEDGDWWEDYIKEKLVKEICTQFENCDEETERAVYYATCNILINAVWNMKKLNFPKGVKKDFSQFVPGEKDEEIPRERIRKIYNFVESQLLRLEIIYVVPNLEQEKPNVTKERVYISNVSLCWAIANFLVREFLNKPDKKEVSRVFSGDEKGAVAECFMMAELKHHKKELDELYYLDRGDVETDGMIVNYFRYKYRATYLFESKTYNQVSIKPAASIVSDKTANVLCDQFDLDVAGRYVIYSGQDYFRYINDKELVFIPPDERMRYYMDFEGQRNLVLSQRYDSKTVREDVQKCLQNGVFDLPPDLKQKYLENKDDI